LTDLADQEAILEEQLRTEDLMEKELTENFEQLKMEEKALLQKEDEYWKLQNEYEHELIKHT
jgi:hypothetical protein